MNSYYSYVKTDDTYLDEVDHATYKGISIKTIILAVVTIGVSVLTMYFLPMLLENYFSGFYITLFVAIFVGFIAAMIGRYEMSFALPASIIYSICQGLLLGTITAIVDAYYPGAGTLAVSATLVVFTIMLVLYAFGFIRNGSKIKMIAFGLLFSALGLFMLDFIYILIHGQDSYTIYFLIQAALLVYGVITLTFNFAEAEAVVQLGAPKAAEWSVALGILVSLIYIYVYILRILLLVASRRR